jgi:hypothetical protein
MQHLTLERELTKAEKCVSQSNDRIAHQRAVVLQHQDEGLVSAIARAILEQLETSQRIYITNRNRLLEHIGHCDRTTTQRQQSPSWSLPQTAQPQVGPAAHLRL